ncbi:ABC transporter ATP-binding protein [Haloglomus litoreum]|uniref:ABC transporter ATP-binding protein n=1 Tax=Haloglomus litoreum TaxID=3034026 RepID=UPI0023E7A5AF|nr:ABC transporter ATP-binding protein [Haloglomus sp. DT116]
MLDVTDLTKRYGDVLAVDDVTLTVEEGEFFSIVGPSGSGKSTLLRCIGGLERPQEGSIALDDVNVTDQRAYERDTSTVFQNLALFPHMTVAENISYGMKRQGVEKAERASRTEEYLDLVDLSGYGDRDTDQLSGGEQQRVALARSLAVRPKLLLLDEPLASLDQQLRVQLQNELYEVQRELDQTAVYVTHDQNVALSISDRVAVMNEGNLEQVGEPYELYENPATEFVARFIGDSSHFEGTVNSVENGHVSFELPESGDVVTGRSMDSISEGARVRGVVKLEDFDLEHPESHPNQLRGTVDRVAYRGQTTKLLLDVEGGGLVEVITSDLHTYTVGETITVGWPPEACSTFEVEA